MVMLGLFSSDFMLGLGEGEGEGVKPNPNIVNK